MKSLVLLAGIATLALPLATAEASVMTIGSGLARSCYEASEARDASRSSIETCSRALSEQPLDRHDQVATHVNRGILYYLSNNLTGANSDYDRAIAIDPNEPEAWLNKAMAALKAGDNRAAAPLFDKALALKTSRPALAYYGRAMVNEDQGNVRQAYADLQRARELDPGWAPPAQELKRYVVRN
jgi:tetratricopeptide (TPR) repeat protein